MKQNQKHSMTGSRKVALRVGIVVAVLVIIGLLYVLVVRPLIDKNEKNSAGDDTIVRDTRSDVTKSATSSADQQAAGGNVDSAYSTLDTTIAKTDPKNIEDLSSLYQTKAVIATNAGQKDVAVAAQNKAIELEPTNYKLVEGLGEIYSFLGDDANAKAAFARASELAKSSGGDPYHGVTSPEDGTN